ncbi:MarR family transcriptional regulator [Sphingomonas gilva]|uniref:MarR family transcriptional regulator n=2 Tax=Sphingomonas gilva TaxID=2305907 RepID=A0A396RS68_9SPHN|nr:MarR family transcriptional regulator [Sphingomonas gilva]
MGDDPVQRLRELGAEVARIAQALSALGPGSGVADRRPPYRGEAGEGAEPSAPAIRAMIRARRTRDQYFAPELFADPAWDILLDLMAARLEGRDVAVSSLCIAAAVPPTTALRWISAMTEQGLLVRIADADDRRRVFIRLSNDAAERMAACLAALNRNGPQVA